MTEKKQDPDWGVIERDYRAGIKSLRLIASEHGITHPAVKKRARRDGWVRNSGAMTETVDDLTKGGFVYVVSIQDTAGAVFHKIGLSAVPVDRMGSHQTSSPFEVRTSLCYWTPAMRREESVLHAMFASKRIRGEWFALERADLETIAKRSLVA